MATDVPFEQVRAWLVKLPLRQQFASARTQVAERRVILLALTAGGNTGWGEAAPVPGHTVDDVDELWGQLAARIDTFGVVLSDRFTGMLAAAVEQAQTDLESRQLGQPIWRILGGSRQVTASAAIGVDPNGRPDRGQIETAVASGYRFVKLKVTPATDPGEVAEVIRQYPQLGFGADANGSLLPGEEAMFRSLDDLGLAFIEQPGPADDLGLHARLRREMTTPLVLDESAASIDSVARIITSRAADGVNLKAGRFGTRTTRRLAGELVAAGVTARIGGLVETGVGRAHAAALGGHELFSVVGDIAASDRYFTDDLVRPQWRLHDGGLRLLDAPGIGVTVDEEAVAAHCEASISATAAG